MAVQVHQTHEVTVLDRHGAQRVYERHTHSFVQEGQAMQLIASDGVRAACQPHGHVELVQLVWAQLELLHAEYMAVRS